MRLCGPPPSDTLHSTLLALRPSGEGRHRGRAATSRRSPPAPARITTGQGRHQSTTSRASVATGRDLSLGNLWRENPNDWRAITRLDAAVQVTHRPRRAPLRGQTNIICQNRKGTETTCFSGLRLLGLSPSSVRRSWCYFGFHNIRPLTAWTPKGRVSPPTHLLGRMLMAFGMWP